MKITIKREQRKTRFGLQSVSNLRDAGANTILVGLAILSAIMFAGCDTKDPIHDATYAITISNDGNGTGAAKVGDTAAELATEGATVTVTATPTGDYMFKQWTVVAGGVTLSPNATTNPATFTMPAMEVEIKAEFEAISRTITMTDDGNGTAVADPADATAGTEVTITATPTGDYAFKQWVVESGPTDLLSDATENPATFIMPTEEVEIKAEFEAISRTITMTDDGNGTAVADPADATAGTEVTITATPTGDYAFKQWVVESGPAGLLADATQSTTTFTMPSEAVTIKAEFEAILYAITMTVNNGLYGTAAADPQSTTEGQTVTLTAIPASADYQFTQWVVVSGDVTLSPNVTTNPATFIMPSEAVTIRAEFMDLTIYTTYNEVGSGSASDPWLLYNGKQLANLAATVNAGTDMSGKYFKQMADVSLSAYADWVAIGTETNPFRGYFDGNGKTISDLSITLGGGTSVDNMPLCLGLFGCVDGGEMKNITVNGTIGPVQFEKSQNVGALIGYLKSGTIDNIKATVSISTTAGMILQDNHVIAVGSTIGRSDVSLSHTVFNVTPTISFGIDGVGTGYVGHNVGYCVNINDTKNANSDYNENDPAITIKVKGGLSYLYINGKYIF